MASESIMDYFDRLLKQARRQNVSDIHLRAGEPPIFRVATGLHRLDVQSLDAEHVQSLIKGLLPAQQWTRYAETGEGDGAYARDAELGRVRVNAFRESGRDAVACRLIPLTPPSLGDLKLPEQLKRLAYFPDGLVLICGPTGSGKSTTLAATVREANENRHAHIMTIEDPIEYVHPSLKSIVSQREVGSDTRSFEVALTSLMRQNPDIVVVGEARDRATMRTALSVAETGHLVFCTLHTVNVQETIMRVLEFFGADEHAHVRHMLAGVLRAVVVQRILPRADGRGRVVAQEIMYASERVKAAIADPEKTAALSDIIAEGHRNHGMQTFDQSLTRLVLDGAISAETALGAASRPQDLKLMLQQATGTVHVSTAADHAATPRVELG